MLQRPYQHSMGFWTQSCRKVPRMLNESTFEACFDRFLQRDSSSVDWPMRPEGPPTPRASFPEILLGGWFPSVSAETRIECGPLGRNVYVSREMRMKFDGPTGLLPARCYETHAFVRLRHAACRQAFDLNSRPRDVPQPSEAPAQRKNGPTCMPIAAQPDRLQIKFYKTVAVNGR